MLLLSYESNGFHGCHDFFVLAFFDVDTENRTSKHYEYTYLHTVRSPHTCNFTLHAEPTPTMTMMLTSCP